MLQQEHVNKRTLLVKIALISYPYNIALQKLQKNFHITHISLAFLFVGHRQTVQTQIRRRRTWRQISVSTVYLESVLLKCE